MVFSIQNFSLGRNLKLCIFYFESRRLYKISFAVQEVHTQRLNSFEGIIDYCDGIALTLVTKPVDLCGPVCI